MGYVHLLLKCVLSGKIVLFSIPAAEPQGGVLSCAADQGRSGGHKKAAGPIAKLSWALIAISKVHAHKAAAVLYIVIDVFLSSDDSVAKKISLCL